MTASRRDRGFTLIELLVVITILGLLVGLAAVNVPQWINKGKVTRAKADIDRIMEALQLYYMEHNEYPSQGAGLEVLREGDAYNPDGYWPENLPDTDPWGSPWIYELDGRKPVVTSLGANKIEGGDGYDEDIRSDQLGGKSDTR
jgi:general secretion pathway protein G